MKKILFVSANPSDTNRLAVAEEARQITRGLRSTGKGEALQLVQVEAARPRDLLDEMNLHRPQFVHFSGHGTESGELILQDEDGFARPVSPESLESLFKAVHDNVEAVVLNACFSETQAAVIAKWVPYAVGTTRAIGDKAAAEFSDAFYSALSYNRTVPEAFEQGKTALQLEANSDYQFFRLLDQSSIQARTIGSRIFISYCHNDPDTTIARALYERLGATHQVFMDEARLVGGMDWAKKVVEEIQAADVFVVLISTVSANSEAVSAEVLRAKDYARLNGGKPRIIPIRVDFKEELYPLHLSALDRLHYIEWKENDEGLASALSAAIAEVTAPQLKSPPHERLDARPIPPKPTSDWRLNPPAGTVPLGAPYYVERASDVHAKSVLANALGRTVIIQGPRQMGKSSLMSRALKAAVEGPYRKKTAAIDFQLLAEEAIRERRIFYKQFCALISRSLRIPIEVKRFWEDVDMVGDPGCCTDYMENYVLTTISQPVVLAIDEVETLFESTFRGEFFGLLRAWHNRRGVGDVWDRLDLLLVTSTEPARFIERDIQSPFNVAHHKYQLVDFTFDEAAEFLRGIAVTMKTDRLERLWRFVGGHPYLLHRALYRIVCGESDLEEILRDGSREAGPFGDHLKNYLLKLYDRPDLTNAYLTILGRQPKKHLSPGEHLRACDMLAGIGLTKNRPGGGLEPRCELYRQYFAATLP